ncbi:MAG TPA: hypothetical protein P5279_18120 [Anaerohalosphaeraceae bacterium]|nr:hypothetical protein [Anaerohalosphaeraceae bacterium]HRT52411.1 hypothetical protein [Anaerohalosphaeraceae bacterium]HRT88364.1 hypothetical protein [Anaerohalosphaeraceae bacterium]
MKKSKKLMTVLLACVVLTLCALFLAKDYFYIKVVLPGRWHPGRWCSEARMKAIVENLAQSKRSIDYCLSDLCDYCCYQILWTAKDYEYRDYIYDRLLQKAARPDIPEKIYSNMLLHEYSGQKEFAVELFLLVKDKTSNRYLFNAITSGRSYLARLVGSPETQGIIHPQFDDDFNVIEIPLTKDEFEKMYGEKVPTNIPDLGKE